MFSKQILQNLKDIFTNVCYNFEARLRKIFGYGRNFLKKCLGNNKVRSSHMDISLLIFKGDWHTIVNKYKPAALAKSLSFKDGRLLAYKMLFNEERDDSLRDYATELLQEIRNSYSKDWSEDWKNDVFLGDACYLTMKYDERYEAYKRAYEKATPPPPSLLISLASCYLSPEPFVTLEEAENLTKKALEKEISIEGVVLLRGIYASKKDQSKFDYWDKILKEVEEKNIHTENDWPDIHC